MTQVTRRRTKKRRFYWAELGFLLLGLIGLRPEIITEFFPSSRSTPQLAPNGYYVLPAQPIPNTGTIHGLVSNYGTSYPQSYQQTYQLPQGYQTPLTYQASYQPNYAPPSNYNPNPLPQYQYGLNQNGLNQYSQSLYPQSSYPQTQYTQSAMQPSNTPSMSRIATAPARTTGGPPVVWPDGYQPTPTYPTTYPTTYPSTTTNGYLGRY